MICDTHTHSVFSFDGHDTVNTMCQKAIENGVKVFTVTDHSEAFANTPFSKEDFDRCDGVEKAISLANKEFGDKVAVLRGCELGQAHFNPQYAKELLSKFSFDFVIGSLHFIPDNLDIYDIEYTRDNYREYIDVYFDEIDKMLDIEGYQALGHFDYILRLLFKCFDGVPNFLDFRTKVEKIIKKAAARGLALEINTKIFQRSGVLTMEEWVLEHFKACGGKHVTVGSDAHEAHLIGKGFEAAFSLLHKTGFKEYTYFIDKNPISVKFS